MTFALFGDAAAGDRDGIPRKREIYQNSKHALVSSASRHIGRAGHRGQRGDRGAKERGRSGRPNA